MDIQAQTSNLAKTAVRYARSFNEELDYSKESIKAVEKILDYYSQDLHNLRRGRKANRTTNMVDGFDLGSLCRGSDEARVGARLYLDQ